MFNRSGVHKTSYGAPVQILANVELQSSVGCIVPQTLAGDAGANGKKIVKAGTPVVVDLMDRQTAVEAADKTANALLLHDVDVTAGDANGTALIFGFVNVNRVDADVAEVLEGLTSTGMVTLMKA